VQANEGAGILSSDAEGALPKNLWDGQKRSEIIKAIQALPITSPLNSVQQIKRDMLISTYDLRKVKNDIPAEENSLLAVRLQKLAQLGYWDDALKLYNQAVEAPEENESLAQIGVTLTFLEKGLSTACLDAKALNSSFSGDFWDQMEAVCNAELYGDKPISTQFGDSAIIKALYFEPNFKISADNINSLKKMSLFEAALAFQKQRIDYKNADLEQISSAIPQKIKRFFEKDKNAPESLKTRLITEASLPPKIDEKSVTQEQIIAYFSAKLRHNARFNESDFQYLYDFANLYPENYFYLAVLAITNKKYGKYISGEDKINLGREKITEKQRNKVELLNSMLDKASEFSNNRPTAYEKQIGILLLSVLSELSKPLSDSPNMGNAGENSVKKGNTPLNRLRNVGLMQQAHLIARELLADIMQSKI
jgi:hypothetical protein